VRFAGVQVEVDRLAIDCPVAVARVYDWLVAGRFPDTVGVDLVPLCLAACWATPFRSADTPVEVGRPLADCPVVPPANDWLGARRFPDAAGVGALPLCLAACWAAPLRSADVQVEVGLVD